MPRLAGSSNYKIVCYYGQWAAYRREPATFNPADVDAETCTHLIYSFVGLDNSSLTLKVLDYDFDVIRGPISFKVNFVKKIQLNKSNNFMQIEQVAIKHRWPSKTSIRT